MISVILDTAFQQGFLYVLAVFGIVISFRLMNFPDLTVDGSFTLGGAVLAVLLTNGYSIIFSTIIAIVAGFLAGTTTAILNRKLGISKILSGILVMLILYSINLRIMGKANISLLRTDTFFTPFESLDNAILILFLFGIAAVFLLALLYLSITRLGLFIRATGDNEFMIRSQGVNTDWVFIIGIGLSNALIAFSGAMVAQSQGFADVNMGIGMIITALAALIIGESFVSLIQTLKRNLFKESVSNDENKSHLPWDTFNEFFSALLGSFLYFLIIAICLQLGLAPTDLKLATGILVIIGIALRFKKTTSETYQKARL
jgi:putative tryptophan/tyrosine transport system permease protein